MLVALIVVGIVTALAALALPPSQNAQMQREAQRLAALFDAARQRAAETGVPLAWAGGPAGYAFVQLGPRGWEPVDSDLLRPRAWPWMGSSGAKTWQATVGAVPHAAVFAAGAVTVDLRQGGGTGPGLPASWLLFGSEPVAAPVELALADGAERDSVSSDGFAPFQVSRSVR